MARKPAQLGLARCRAVSTFPDYARITGAIGAIETGRDTRTATRTFIGTAVIAGAIAAAPVASAAPTKPSVQTRFTHTTKGLTLTYGYSDSGLEYPAFQADEITPIATDASVAIDFGDGTRPVVRDGLNGAACMTGDPDVTPPAAPFSTTLGPGTHTYAKSGVYTIKITTGFCGGPASSPDRRWIKSVVRTVQVTVGSPTTSSPTTPATASSKTTPPRALPNTASAPASTMPKTPAAGPVVQTDYVAAHDEALGLPLAAGASLDWASVRSSPHDADGAEA